MQCSGMGTNGIDGIDWKDSSLKGSEEVGGSDGSAAVENKYSHEGFGAVDVKAWSGRRTSVLGMDGFSPKGG